MVTRTQFVIGPDAWAVAAAVPDPELPMLTLADLGILRSVVRTDAGTIVTITPTYSGCPAMREIALDLQRSLARAGIDDAEIRTTLDPPWTSDWITADGRRKLADAGIAPPQPARRTTGPVPLNLRPRRLDVACPQCASADTTQLAAFGATACRALYRCAICGEPFEYVKEI